MYIHNTNIYSAKSKKGRIIIGRSNTSHDISLNFAIVTSFAVNNFSTFVIDVVCVSPGHTCGYLQKRHHARNGKHRAFSVSWVVAQASSSLNPDISWVTLIRGNKWHKNGKNSSSHTSKLLALKH